MSMINYDALDVLTSAQVQEACRLIDAIGFVSNDLGSSIEASSLNRIRTDLKYLFHNINDGHQPPII